MTVPLSPAAQAVLDALHNTPVNSGQVCDGKAANIKLAAAALRAAGLHLQNAYANEEYVDHADDFLFDLASELEKTNG